MILIGKHCKYSAPKTTSIGRRDDEHADTMYPNANCMKFFPDIEIPEELEKIEMLKSSDNTYRIDHAVSATRKTILKAFGMNATGIKTLGRALSEDLKYAAYSHL